VTSSFDGSGSCDGAIAFDGSDGFEASGALAASVLEGIGSASMAMGLGLSHA
jgi:hypothetical protein